MATRTETESSWSASRSREPGLGLSAVLLGVLLLSVSGCGDTQPPLFVRLDSKKTGVDFVNRIATDDSLMNPLDFFYVYNGGGVAAGDVNGDGRPDLYFAGNTGPNRLYLNQGDFQFREVTDTAGVAAEGVWSTGLTLVDINQDGRLDIYVSVGGPPKLTDSRSNRLYVNQGTGPDGVPTFDERAKAYGIADPGYTTHAAFFDYDQDGDLDLYVLNTATVQRRRRPTQAGSRSRSVPNGDRLYRNDGDGSFTNVTQEAGITGGGYGLGLAVSDVNKDGWPDVYAANDLYTRDRLYINQRDGTFADRSRQYLRHQSYSAMGVDIADFNNDRRSDIMVLDMLPKDPRRRRLISNVGTRADGMWQYGRNTLQLNNGVGPDGQMVFSEIGQLADVEATGWSWAPLLADYDNDGDRDLFVSNGYGKLVTHLDFVERRRQARFSGSRKENREALFKALRDLPTAHLTNRFFENEGSPEANSGDPLQFTERTGAWVTEHPGISNGAAFADFDRDGDLDLVTNNINEEATLLKNRTSERTHSNALRIDLHGPDGNRRGLGTKLLLFNDGTTQYHTFSPYRGYQSTVQGIVHFGLGADSTADSLKVVWPDGSTRFLTSVKANQVLDVHYEQARGTPEKEPPDSSGTARTRLLFRASADRRGLDHRHQETEMGDFRVNPLLPHRYSKNGPGIAVGDVDGNGLDDVFVGADLKHRSVLFRQQRSGRFRKQRLSFGGGHNDMGSLFFDADMDGDQDLYVVSGGNAGPPDNYKNTYQDRLYLNDGDGNFKRAKGSLPDITASGSVVTAADYDRDGDLDLFVGGRVRPRHYPVPPRSYVLRNDTDGGTVKFTDVTASVAPGLTEIGLVSDALWTDFNDDGETDLLLVGEWMPITFFKNEEGQFTNVTETVGPENTKGWWNSLAAGDFDRDGDTDYVAGNLGLNTRFEASPTEPVRVHSKDFNEDGILDPIISHYMQGTSYPAHGRRELTDNLPGMLARFPANRIYAGASFEEAFTEEQLKGAHVEKAVRFETSYLENRKDGSFGLRALPMRVQTGPVFGMQTGDYNGDGHLDLLMVGNWYAPDRETGRADAFVGAFLRGDGTGHFTPVSYPKSGFLVGGDAKALATVSTGAGAPLLVATQNNDSLRVFTALRHRGKAIQVRPLDRYAMITLDGGATRKVELYYGSTYLSQSSRTLRIPPNAEKVVLHGLDGSRRVNVKTNDQ